MPMRTTANLYHLLAEEECSNATLRRKLATALRTQTRQNKELIELRKKLATALCTQTKQNKHLIQLRKQGRDLTDRLSSKCAQIADNDEELFELRTQVAALTDALKRARCVCQGGSGVRTRAQLARLKVTDDSA